ncbi:MAG TPA: hypothetical protein ENJ69_04850 [Bacteroidetes bacterium]|nr:hypothetical protein [Bacteroidota bacterium]
MDKTSLLFEIKKELEGLLGQTQKLEKEAGTVHQIDKDLLLEKTRRLYEKMMALEEAGKTEKAPVQEPEALPPTEKTKPEPVPEPPLPGAKTQQKAGQENKPEIKTPEPEAVPEEMQKETSEKTVAEEAASAQEKPQETAPAEKKPESPVPEEKPEPEVSAAKPAETTLDLFSAAPKETLGDTLKPSEKPALADTLQSSGISDLREAIGINDKFLFINELFNGDLERYNKVLDELNGFAGLSGAQTYLAELQVQYQWDEESPAYRKLSDLLERKFS